jgi:hypothetical protein
MVGTGPHWKAIEALFTTQCRQLGLATGGEQADTRRPSTFRRPSAQQQLF